MDKRMRAVAEDLLPLYGEGLLSEDTVLWLEEQLDGDEELRKLAELSGKPLAKPEPPPHDYERMMRGVRRKLAIYQVIFMALSFYLAIRTSLLNESFEFVLWYAVLGLVTYLFYKDMRTVVAVAFVPVFLWSIGSSLADMGKAGFVMQIVGAVWVSLIHFVFAWIGAAIAWLLLRTRGKDEAG